MDKVTVKYKGRKNLGCRSGLSDGSLATSNLRPLHDCDIPNTPTHVDSNCALMHRCNDCMNMFYAITSVVAEVMEEENKKEIKPAILPQQNRA